MARTRPPASSSQVWTRSPPVPLASVTVTIPVPSAEAPLQDAVTASTGLPTWAATAAAQAATSAA